jgi:hypothetical protein
MAIIHRLTPHFVGRTFDNGRADAIEGLKR